MKIKGSEIQKYYVERDLSWMYFNRRILKEASKEEVPLLERLNFLGIYSNNLDEFFRVRVATLNRIIEYKDKGLHQEKEKSSQTLKRINKLNARSSVEFENTVEEVIRKLKEENICLIDETEAEEDQKEYVFSFYKNNLNGSTNPILLPAIKELGDQTDENIYLAVQLSSQNKEEEKTLSKNYALIEIPVEEFGRFIRLPDKEGKSYLMYLDDVIRLCLPLIFAGTEYNNFEAYSLKFTKDAEMEMDTDLRNSVLQKISKAVKSRKKGQPIRVIYDAKMPKELLKKVMDKLNVDKLDTVLAGGRYHNHKDLMKFPDFGRKDLKFLPQPPIFKPELSRETSILSLIRQQDRFIHVPYHDFNTFLRILREAAINEEVKSIKITLYRLAKDSKVVKTLIGAARNGKKVTVVIELLARFDEASNIDWSKKMQDAGIQVIFGVEGLKIHSKITYIGMEKGDIACISTGNFHEGNARAYTDYLMMTAHKTLVKEVNEVFNFIEKPYLPVKFKELIVSPNEMRKKLIALINTEIKNKQAGKPAYILAKLNHITDKVLIAKLYEASAKGVKIDLLVRGNCSLTAGIPGVSENIRINGIIDRYLEHARIFIFANAGDEKYYIGSADWMSRNLDHRIEVIAPVYDPEIRRDLKRVISYGLKDTLHGYTVDGSGRNAPWCTATGTPFSSQKELYEYYLDKSKNIN